MEIADLHIEEKEFDLFLNLNPKDKIEFLHNAGSYGMDTALSKLFTFLPEGEEDEIEFEADFDVEFEPEKNPKSNVSKEKQVLNDLFQDTVYEEMFFGPNRLNVLIINKSIHINSNSLKWIRKMVLKLWMDGHILMRNKFAKKIPGIDKYRYYRCYDIIGTVPPICLS